MYIRRMDTLKVDIENEMLEMVDHISRSVVDRCSEYRPYAENES